MGKCTQQLLDIPQPRGGDAANRTPRQAAPDVVTLTRSGEAERTPSTHTAYSTHSKPGKDKRVCTESNRHPRPRHPLTQEYKDNKQNTDTLSVTLSLTTHTRTRTHTHTQSHTITHNHTQTHKHTSELTAVTHKAKEHMSRVDRKETSQTTFQERTATMQCHKHSRLRYAVCPHLTPTE